jgi:lysophospholipase L1-like esterase
MTILESIFSRLLVLSLIAAPAFAGTTTYLALGDSISFGYSPNVVPPPVSQYVGYPEIVAALLNPFQSGTEVNASCPGQTSQSFLIGGPDNNCDGPMGFKAAIGLHTNYPGTQAMFALTELASNPNINLVTLSIGGDDLLLLQQYCVANSPPADFESCVTANIPSALSAYATNLGTILGEIRSVYSGNLVLVLYSAPNTNPLFIEAVSALNNVMEEVGAHFGVKIADGFTAFQIASAPHGGDPCKAGLLVPLTTGGCDVHPTFAGQDLLAATVLQALSLPALTSGNNCNGTYYGAFHGNLNVSNDQTCILVGGGVTGNITQNGGSLGIGNVTIGGNVQVNGGGAFSVGPAAVINGNLQIQNDPAGMASSQVCGSTVKGDLQFQNNGSPMVIGWAAPWCAGDVIGGNLEVHNNTASIAILNNTVGGNVQVQNNTASTQVFNNIVRQNLQCQSNSPATTGGGNTAAQKQGQCSAF